MLFDNSWEPKMCQLIAIGSHWGFVGCSLVGYWGSFGGHLGVILGFLKNLNFDFGNKFDYLICHSVLYIFVYCIPPHSVTVLL